MLARITSLIVTIGLVAIYAQPSFPAGHQTQTGAPPTALYQEVAADTTDNAPIPPLTTHRQHYDGLTT